MSKFGSSTCFLLTFCLANYVLISEAITSCVQTPHPEVCKYFLQSDSLVDGDSLLIDHSLTVTSNLVKQARESLSLNVKLADPRADSAWSDCLDLYDDTLECITSSTTDRNPDDLQTLISAAIANQETCKNGFADLNMAVPSAIALPLMANISMLLSNALAINKPGTAPFLRNGGRKLLADGFPSWVSYKDRKLLQSSGVSGANAVVAKDGSGDYTTIGEAVAKAGGGGSRFVIHVKAGVYQEYVTIPKSKKNIMLVGDGAGSTVITGNKHAGQTTTFRSATFAVMGEGFIGKDITFENTAGPQNHQAVAFRSGSDRSVCYGCSFIGYQDTLYVYSMRQFYRDCSVYGTVDFIFGDAVAVLQNCNIYIRKPMSGQRNTVTASGRTDPNENTGIIIQSSKIMGSAGLGGGISYLGRPWQKYARTVIMTTSIDSVINPAGWLPWSGSFALSTLYYAEYMNTGGGASTSGRVKWGGYHALTSSTEASKFTVGNFLSGNSWIPATGVPFDSGL